MKNVVITGAGSGLGASLARKYHERGYHVTLLGRTVKKLALIAEDFEHYALFKLDVSSYTDVERTFKKIKDEVGSIDLLINFCFTFSRTIDEEITRTSKIMTGMSGQINR